MSGRIIKPRWGDKAQTFDFEIEDERVTLDDWFPPEVISTKYFENAPDMSLGFPMSVLWGFTKTICPRIDTNTWLISGHHLSLGGWFSSSDSVTKLYEDASDTSDARVIQYGYGGSPIDNGFSIENSSTRKYGSSYDMPVCVLKNDGTYAVNDESVLTVYIRGMPMKKMPLSFPTPVDPVNLLWTLYTEYTGFTEDDIDKETFSNAHAKGLHKLWFSSTFNGFGGDRMKCIDTIHKRILPQLPCFEFYNQGKLGLAFVDIWGDGAGDQLNTVQPTPNIKMDFIYGYNILDRIGLVDEGDEDEIRNNFFIKYNLDINNKSGGWLSELHITHGGKEVPITKDTIISPRCVASYGKFGHRTGPTIYAMDIPATDVSGSSVKSGRTAAHVLGEWLEYMFTFRPKYLTVLGDNSCLLANPGDFIRYTEPGIGFYGKPCLIVGKSTGLSRSKFKLRTWENMLTTVPV